MYTRALYRGGGGHAAHSCLPLPPHPIDVSHFHCLSATHALHALHGALALSTNVSHTTPSNIKSMDVTKIRQIREIRSSHRRSFSPERCGREEGRMSALVAGYRNMAATLECPQHPSRRAIQNFCLRDRNFCLRNLKKKNLLWTSITSVRHTRDVFYGRQ